MRLNRWQRIGVVLSVVWMVSAAIYQRNADIDRAESFSKDSFQVCLDSKSLAHNKDISSCEQEREKSLAIWMTGSWGNVAFIALAPIPLSWLTGFILIYIGRAQVIGFRAVVPWGTMTLPRKSFVVGCILFGSIIALFGVLIMLNLYVDKQVPVSLGFKFFYQSDDVVSAKGTWTREDSKDGSISGFPLQTSEINCYRKWNQCFEARATVNGGMAFVELVEYEIESWSDTTIVFRNDFQCFSEVFTIDLKTKSVNGIGRAIAPKNEGCRLQNSEWSYHLIDGFKVYWEQKQKARPLLLRLIQTLLGN